MFAVTQVTRLLSADPTWRGALRGMLVLAALWGAWNVHTWLTSTMDVDEGGVRLGMLVSIAAWPWRRRAPLETNGCCSAPPTSSCGSFRGLSAVVTHDDPARRSAIVRFAPTAIVGGALLVLAGFVEGSGRIALWVAGLAIDYLGPAVIGMGSGWRVNPEHFAERHGLLMLGGQPPYGLALVPHPSGNLPCDYGSLFSTRH